MLCSAPMLARSPVGFGRCQSRAKNSVTQTRNQSVGHALPLLSKRDYSGDATDWYWDRNGNGSGNGTCNGNGNGHGDGDRAGTGRGQRTAAVDCGRWATFQH
jgi:hypothetical protein